MCPTFHFLIGISNNTKRSEYDKEIPQSHAADNPWHHPIRHTTLTNARHNWNILSKSTSSQMIPKLERTLSTA